MDPNNKCQVCSCLEGNLLCTLSCSDRKDVCQNKSNSLYDYTWIEPSIDQCCGVCQQSTSIYVFFVFVNFNKVDKVCL